MQVTDFFFFSNTSKFLILGLTVVHLFGLPPWTLLFQCPRLFYFSRSLALERLLDRHIKTKDGGFWSLCGPQLCVLYKNFYLILLFFGFHS